MIHLHIIITVVIIEHASIAVVKMILDFFLFFLLFFFLFLEIIFGICGKVEILL